MNKLLAVSGGVDSVVMLDMLCQNLSTNDEIFVAHFNHGTRSSANDDQQFVKNLAEQKYHKKFFTKKVNLGANVSESAARAARYDFLYQTAKILNAKIYTAHHLDDLAESVAINFIRGTGWRGLSALSNPDIERPFIVKNYQKSDILKYAAKHNLTWRHDPTNSSDQYLRNRLRENLKHQDVDCIKLASLCSHQKSLKLEIENLINHLLPQDGMYLRSWFDHLDKKVAVEFLKSALESRNISATRPQIIDFLQAIKTYAPEKSFNLPGGKLVKLHKNFFTL